MSTFNWGKGIILAVTVFVIATLSVVSYIISLDFYLVSSTHYEDGEQYQETIDKKNRAAGLSRRVLIYLDEKNDVLRIIYPDDYVGKVQGDVLFYRPDNPALDHKVPLSVNTTGTQLISVSDLKKGRWRLKLEWQMDDISYLEETTILI